MLNRIWLNLSYFESIQILDLWSGIRSNMDESFKFESRSEISETYRLVEASWKGEDGVEGKGEKQRGACDREDSNHVEEDGGGDLESEKEEKACEVSEWMNECRAGEVGLCLVSWSLLFNRIVSGPVQLLPGIFMLIFVVATVPTLHVLFGYKL